MTGWTHELNDVGALQKYSPTDLSDPRDFEKQLQGIDNNQSLTVLDKYKQKKQLMRAAFIVKQQEINHHLDSFENYMLARKDVEAKSITLEAQKAIMHLEREQLALMDKLGLTHSEEISDTLIKAGTLLTQKLEEVRKAKIEPEIKKMTMNNIRTIWEKTNKRILDSVDLYMDELQARERGRR
jgi:hypothetical protein